MFKNFEDLQATGKERFEAATAASASFFRGLQQIAAETSSLAGTSFKNSLGLIGEISGDRTFEEAVQAQSSYAKALQDAFFSQTAKIGELYVDLTREAFRPVDLAVAKVPVKARQGGAPLQG